MSPLRANRSPVPSPKATERSSARSKTLPVRHRLGEGGSLPAVSSSNPSKGFTIVEVMMASLILVVGFMGMIQAITIGSEMLATARRQTVAAQIISHETEKLRLKSWTYVGTTLVDAPESTYSSDSTELTSAISASGVTFTLAIDVTDVTTDLREVEFTVTWTKSGTTTAATTTTGSWFQNLAFSRSSPISRKYIRKGTTYFGKYGLNLNTQRS